MKRVESYMAGGSFTSVGALNIVGPMGTFLIGKLIVVVLRQHQKGGNDRARKSKRGAIPQHRV
jgi:hypothetical protein